MDTFYTVEEVATQLKVQPRTVRYWIQSHQLPAARAGRQWRIREQDLAVFLQGRPAPAAKESL
jgi:excisionase family DNA binding protein